MSEILAVHNAWGQGGVPLYEGPAADLPWVEPAEADLAAIEAGACWEAVQQRLDYLLTQQAALRAVDELGVRRTRRRVAAVLAAAIRPLGGAA